MLENIIPKKCFASIQLDNKVIACGMGVLEHDFIGVFDIVVDVNYRNQGYGRQLILNLLRWGKVNGAKNAYLQVMLDNLPALKLYSNLGFQEIYKYWYRIKIQDIKLSSFLKERTQFPISLP
jgi:ribosomal protein S18 acetylase RimI-like enzyme